MDDDDRPVEGVKELIAAAEQELIEGLRANDVPFEKIGYDWYDQSLELYGVPPDYRLTDEAHACIADCGFVKVFVNHTDFWETHYNFRPLANRYGWRSCSPHRRKDGTDEWWLEEEPREVFPCPYKVFPKTTPNYPDEPCG